LLGLSGLSSVFLGLARRHRASFPTNGNPARGPSGASRRPTKVPEGLKRFLGPTYQHGRRVACSPR
jgi:hypothetical protein